MNKFHFGYFFSNTLKEVKRSPEVMRRTPATVELSEPSCHFPESFSGGWANAANIDADIFINKTHFIETYNPDKEHYRRTAYVCKKQRDSRIMMERIAVDGW